MLKTVQGFKCFPSNRFLLVIALAGLFGAFVIQGCADSEEKAEAEAVVEEPAVTPEAASAVADSIAEAEAQAQVEAEAILEEEEVASESAAMPSREGLTAEPGVFTVQIASYASRELAMPFYERLQAEGKEPYLLDELITIDGQESVVYRLRFGRYDSKDEAHNRGSEVALKYELDYWVDNLRR